MFLIRTTHENDRENSFLSLKACYRVRTAKFWHPSMTKNVRHHLKISDPAVQIFPIKNDLSINFSKIAILFLLGTLFQITTTSKKMFLIRTLRWKCMHKLSWWLNELFPWLNTIFSLFVRFNINSSTDESSKSSGWDWTAW